MSLTDSEPVTVGITVPSIAPQDLLDRVTAMAEDLARAGISVELDVIRTCRSCGCTDDRACFLGCTWVSETEDLCSSCSPTPPAAADDVCPHPIRVDGNGHSWKWDGDDPRVECAGCQELRDAHTGQTIRPGRSE